MKIHFGLLAILTVIIPTAWSYSSVSYYNCLKPSMGCKNGGTCLNDTKICSCPSGFVGDDCGVTTANINGNGCSLGTCPVGVCEAGPVCVCPPSSYGQKCNLGRFALVCDTNRMLILINPYPTFNGEIYVMGKGTQSACVFAPLPVAITDSSIPKNSQGRYLELTHDDPVCGNAERRTETTTNHIIYSRNIEIAYMQGNLTFVLDHFQFYCRFLPLTQTVDGGSIFVEIAPTTTTTTTQAPTGGSERGTQWSIIVLFVSLLAAALTSKTRA